MLAHFRVVHVTGTTLFVHPRVCVRFDVTIAATHTRQRSHVRVAASTRLTLACTEQWESVRFEAPGDELRESVCFW